MSSAADMAAPPFHAARRSVADLGSCDSGAALLEFALVLPILVVLLGGAFELGRALLIREAMIGAVRNGASYLARLPDPSCVGGCGPGVTRAMALARDQIAENTGLPGSAVTVTTGFDPEAQTVTLQAGLQVEFHLLGLAGFAQGMPLDIVETERHLAR